MEQDKTGIVDFLRMLWRRKLALVSAALISALGAVVIVKSLPARYTAEGMLLVEQREPAIPELSWAAGSGAGGMPTSPRTEVSLLRSRALAEDVVRSLDLAARPEFGTDPAFTPWPEHLVEAAHKLAMDGLAWLGLRVDSEGDASRAAIDRTVEKLQRNLGISTEDNQRAIWVRYEAPTPTLAAEVVNAVMEQFIARELVSREQMTKRLHEWLAERANALRKEVEAADRRVQELRDRNALFNIQAGSLSAVLLSSEQSQLSNARLELARLETALATINKAGGSGGTAAASQEALASPLIQRLREREADAIQRLTGFERRLGSRHPDTVAAREELRDLRQQISAETAKIATSLRRDVEIARERVAELTRTVAAAEEKVRHAAKAEVTLDAAVREADAKRQVYQAFLARADQTEIASSQFVPARIASAAVPPFRPSNPSAGTVAAFGGFGGMFLMAAFLLLGSQIRGRIGSAETLTVDTGVPNLGSLPVVSGRARRLLPQRILDLDQSGTAETLRGLRIALQQADGRGALGTAVLITSPTRGDGKTTVAAALARVCAADGARVLLVEADLRRPGLAKALGEAPAGGMEALLADGMPFEDVVQVDPQSGMHCLFASGSAANPQRLLHSQRLADLMRAARRRYDLIIVDSPPVLSVSDPVLLSTYSDLTVLLVRSGKASRSMVAEAIRRFPSDRARRVVTVLNGVSPRHFDMQGYYSGYGRSRGAEIGRLPAPTA
ncbi:MAG: polysaccharide biosynthesis tyrosine autokinase [Acetobacteraceae bacterium]|nr:polysaccharide biosynthesis tyrosine autokinase [Acetobacteraceae bacterium]